MLSSRGYLGNKARLLAFIQQSIRGYVTFPIHFVADIFCGTGVVTHMFANWPGVKYVRANDAMPYAVVMTRARVSKASDQNVEREILSAQKRANAYLSGNPPVGWIERHHATGERPSFTRANARMLDALIHVITSPTQVHAKAAMLDATLAVNNGFAKFSSAKYAGDMRPQGRRPIHLTAVSPRGATARVHVSNVPAQSIAFSVKYDVIYLDPPYTSTSDYARWYHVLNTLVLRDHPEVYGKYHVRRDCPPSVFTHSRTAMNEFAELFKKCAVACRVVCISYTTSGTVSISQMTQALKDAGFKDIVIRHAALQGFKGGVAKEVLIMATSTLCGARPADRPRGSRIACPPERP